MLVGIGLRWFSDDVATHTPGGMAILSLVAAALTVVGGSLGGSLAYDYGFNWMALPYRSPPTSEEP